jgi:hypothetical protein
MISTFLYSSPMWRRTLHDRIGYFNNSLSPVSDWELWLRGVANDQEMWFLNETLSMYTINESSFGRKGMGIRQTIDSIYHEYEALLECRSLHILIIHERIPVAFEGGDRRIWQVIKWLHKRGHKLHFFFRLNNKGESPASDAFLSDIAESMFFGDMQLERLPNFMGTKKFDAVIMTVW